MHPVKSAISLHVVRCSGCWCMHAGLQMMGLVEKYYPVRLCKHFPDLLMLVYFCKEGSASKFPLSLPSSEAFSI